MRRRSMREASLVLESSIKVIKEHEHTRNPRNTSKHQRQIAAPDGPTSQRKNFIDCIVLLNPVTESPGAGATGGVTMATIHATIAVVAGEASDAAGRFMSSFISPSVSRRQSARASPPRWPSAVLRRRDVGVVCRRSRAAPAQTSRSMRRCSR